MVTFVQKLSEFSFVMFMFVVQPWQLSFIYKATFQCLTAKPWCNVCVRVRVCDALKPPHYRLSVLHPPRQPTVHHFRNRIGSISLKFDSRSRCTWPLLDAFIHSPYNTASIGGPRGNQTFLFFSLSPFLSFSSFWGEWLKICIGLWMIRVQLLSSLSEYTYNRRKMLRGNYSIVW